MGWSLYVDCENPLTSGSSGIRREGEKKNETEDERQVDLEEKESEIVKFILCHRCQQCHDSTAAIRLLAPRA